MKTDSLAKLGSEELTSKLIEIGRTKTFYAGSEIFRSGETAEFLPIVLEGKLKVVRFLEVGKEIILNLFSDGEMFAIPPILDGREYPATAIAIDDTKLLLIYKNEFDELLKNSPEFSSIVMSKMSELMRDITSSMENLAIASPEKRVGNVLLKLAAKETASGSVKISIRRQDIAEMAGLTTETTIREVRKLADKNLIEIVRGKIFIEDNEKLKAYLR
ncbi:MAG: Crp/Fnr family transcriptional regulator [Pyrinomonadaceae bacterium]|nr:Crp/Fnr family transcriptional regulator [Pyrinomonadaceae bacterium]